MMQKEVASTAKRHAIDQIFGQDTIHARRRTATLLASSVAVLRRVVKFLEGIVKRLRAVMEYAGRDQRTP